MRKKVIFQERNEAIMRTYVHCMEWQSPPGKRKTVYVLAEGYKLSTGTVYKIIKTMQQNCIHRFYQPYPQGSPEYFACSKCWTTENR